MNNQYQVINENSFQYHRAHLLDKSPSSGDARGTQTGRIREDDFAVEFNLWPPMHISKQYHHGHVLMFNLGGPLTCFWKSEDQWNKSVCDTGTVVEFLSLTPREEMQWAGEYHALRIMLSPTFVDTLLHTTHGRFQSLRNVDDEVLKDVAFKLYDVIRTGDHDQKIYMKSLCIACVMHLASCYSLDCKKIFAPKGKLSSGQLRTVIEYVKSHINNNIGLEELASSVHLSIFHFSRLFKQTVGMSPYHFVLELKIERAKKLMRERQGSISDVAYTLSFTDQAHFSNAFKKITGQSPRQFWIAQRS